MLTVQIQSINRAERAIYDNTKFYLWYEEPKGKSNRLDLETSEAYIANEIIGRIQFISKKIKTTLPLQPKETVGLI